MSLTRAGISALRNLRPKAGGSGGPGWFSEGTQTGPNGILFGETPPPPGQSRKWESWEGPWYFMLAGSAVLLGLGLAARPDSSITTWARKQARAELKAEGIKV